MKNTFEERQQFDQWWVWLPLIGITAIPLFWILREWLLQPDSSISVGQLIFLVLMLLLLLFFRIIRMETRIDEQNIHLRFFPFVTREIPWSEVQEAKLLDYGFVGGWGIRLTARYGTVYNIRGSKGLALTLAGGKKLCIGTQQPNELKVFLQGIYPQRFT